MDFAPLEADAKEMSRSLLNLRNLPKKLDRIGKSVLGKEPVMPRSPDELAGMAQKTIAGHLETIDELESMTKSLHASFGHKEHFDLKYFEEKRRELLQGQKDALKMGREAQSAQDDLLAMNKKLVAQGNAMIQDVYSPENLALRGVTEAQAREAGVPYEGLDIPDDTGNPFHDRGFPLVVEARRRLENDARTLDRLKRLGLEQETIEFAWLGVLPEEQVEQLDAWGLEADTPEDKSFVLPKGLLMPRFDDAVLNRVMVRTEMAELPETDENFDLPGTHERPAREKVSPGSDSTPLALYPAVEEAHWVRVADELQALYVEQEVGDACGVISLAAPTEKPDPDAEKEIKAGVFLCLMPQGTKAESEVWKKWAKAFPNAKLLALPQGDTVFQTALAGHDIRKLILDALPEDFAKEHSVEFTFSKDIENLGVEFPSLKFPKMDIGAKIDSWHKQAADAFAPMTKELDANADEGFAALDDLSKKASGVHFIKAEKPPDEAGTKALIDDYRRLIGETKAGLVGTPYLPPEKVAAFDKADATLAAAAKKFTALETRGQNLMTELGAREKELDQLLATNCIPGMSPEEMREAGLDPAKGIPLTREQVIAMLERHESFVERNFDGTDLSGLDMSGVDMSKSVLFEANLKGTRLEGAGFDKTIFHNCDLTRASFQDARFRLAVFDGCKMPETNFRNAQWDKTCCKESDLTGADLSDADLQLAVLHKCKLQNANCSNASVRLAVFDKSDASGMLFRNARMQKGMLKDCCVDNADFSGATVNRVMFHGSKGKEVCFAGTDMSHGRMTGNTELPGADFQGACLDASSFRETNLSGAYFKDATLNQALFELCDLTRARLRLVKAHGARLLKTNFEGADMAGMDLFMGSLRKSRLVDTDLTAANLYSTDLFKSVMHNTKLDRANLKRTLLHRREEYIG